jgi:hypothetical protein
MGIVERWAWWLTPPYGAEVRRRQAVAEIHRWQEEERAEALRLRLPGVAEILGQSARTEQSGR